MIITPEHFKYLYVQRGEVAHAYEEGFDAWKAAYELSLATIQRNITPALPPADSVHEILDVGSGLSGIGIGLCRHFTGARLSLLDGTDDPPKVRRHSETFSNAAVAADFLRANGVGEFNFYSPHDDLDRRFDLVVSFAAWCFHIPPHYYLDDVYDALAPNATVILDVRKDKEAWQWELRDAFGDDPVILETGKKHVRMAWAT